MPDGVTATINGQTRTLAVHPAKTLLRALREDLDLTGAKEGCGQGDCGSCTLLLDGRAVNSCLVLVGEVDGGTITTVEGIARDAQGRALQHRFREEWGFQCGYCTPGMLMSCYAVLQREGAPDAEDVREAIEGNLCRCTNYRAIIDATLAAASDLEAGDD